MVGSRTGRLAVLAATLLVSGCSEQPHADLLAMPAEAVARIRSPLVLAGCFDLHVGHWNQSDAPGRRNFRLPPTIMLRFNARTDSVRNDTYRLEPSVRRGGSLHTGRWTFQTGPVDSVKMLWSDGREGVLILMEPLSRDAMTGVAVATFEGEMEPNTRAPISMLRKSCEMRGRL